MCNEPQIVSKPLNQRAGNRDRTFERIDRRSVAQLVAKGREQPAGRWKRAFPGVHQHEAARAISVLCFARVQTCLTEQRGLLIAQNSGNRHSLKHAGRMAIDFA